MSAKRPYREIERLFNDAQAYLILLEEVTFEAGERELTAKIREQRGKLADVVREAYQTLLMKGPTP